MSYRQLVEKLPGWETMTESEAVAAALAKSKTYIDPDRWSLLGIASVIGQINMPSLINFLEVSVWVGLWSRLAVLDCRSVTRH